MHNGTQYDVGWVTSVNWQQGAVTLKTVNSNALDGSGNISIAEFTPWGTATTWNVLEKTASGYEWTVPTWGVQVDSASPIQVTKIRAGTQAQYEALGTYDNTTVYLTI